MLSIGSLWIPALWGHVYNHNVTFMQRMVSLDNYSASKLVSSFGLRVFGSTIRWLVDSFMYPIWRRTSVCQKVVLRRNSRSGNAVSKNIFLCEVREYHHVRKISGAGGGWQLLSLPVPGCVPGSHHSRPWVIGHMRPPDRFSLACESFLNYRNFCRSMIFTRLIVISIMFSKLQRNKIY